MHKLPEHAVYSDVKKYDLILPYKRKYTIRDFRKLVAEGWEQIDARWIVVCSMTYWHCEAKKPCDVSKVLETERFVTLCQLGMVAV